MSQPYANPGYTPPRVQRVATVARDSRGMTALRATAYVLTSLASLLFIGLVIYGYVELHRAQATLDGVLGGSSVPSFVLPTAAPDPP